MLINVIKKILWTCLFLLLGILSYCTVVDNINRDSKFPDPNWSTNILFGSTGILPSEIAKISVFYSDKDHSGEQDYSDFLNLKQKPIFTLTDQNQIMEFLSASSEQLPGGDFIDLRHPENAYHIILWKENHKGFGYGRLLIFRQNGHEYSFVKAADGTGDFRYNENLLKYINKIQNQMKK